MIWIMRGLVAVGALVVGGLLMRRSQQAITYPDAASLIIAPNEAIVASRQADGSTTVTWRDAGREATITPRVVLAAAQGGPVIAPVTATGEANIPDLDSATRYVFDVTFTDDPTRTFTVAERNVPLASVANLRDIGGYPARDGKHVRWGRVYRAGRLSEMTPADWAYLEQLNVRTICDMRSSAEIEDSPDKLPAEHNITMLHRPLNEANTAWERERMMALIFNRRRLTDVMIRSYTHVMVDENATLFGDILTQIADEDNLPYLLHCTAGKDRTGVAMALLLSVLGVKQDIIVADYTLSNRYYENFRRITEHIIERLRFSLLEVDELFPLMVADARVMWATLAHIQQKYGSVENYLVSAAGVDAAIIQRLRELLLE